MAEGGTVLSGEFILKNYKILTDEQIILAMKSPELLPHVLAVISRFSDEKLRLACPLMTMDVLRNTVPKLQLQQLGVIVTALSPAQVRQIVYALPPDDRFILQQNVSLFGTSSSIEELQSFVSFIEPLALSVAAQSHSQAEKIIEVAGVMTLDQIRAVVPMLSSRQVIKLLATLEEERQVETSLSMIDNQGDIPVLLLEELPSFSAKSLDISMKLRVLENSIELQSNNEIEKKDNSERAKFIKEIKSEVEQLQKQTRQLLSQMKLPLHIFNHSNQQHTRAKFQDIHSDSTAFCKRLKEIFLELDKQITELSKEWTAVCSPVESGASDSVYEDSDTAVGLYEAIKEIGNPDAIGSHYNISWTDIINAGFRSSQDFKERNIKTFEQLQRYLQSQSLK